jgi:hypothetical protein
MADLLVESRQLSSTVGLREIVVCIQEESAFACIGDTIAIGCILYDSGFPIVLEDNLRIPPRADLSRIFVIPIGGIHISSAR